MSYFEQENELSARQVILEKLDGQERNWEAETKICTELIKPLLKSEMTICDLGCGIGRLSLTIAPYVKTIYGVDQSNSMLKLFKANINKNNFNHLKAMHTSEFFNNFSQPIDLFLAVFFFQHVKINELLLFYKKIRSLSHSQTLLLVINTPNRYVPEHHEYKDDGINLKSNLENEFPLWGKLNLFQPGLESVAEHHFFHIYRTI